MTLSDLGPYTEEPGYADAVRLDETDELARCRDWFVETDPGLLYLDGNSLGRLPRKTAELVSNVTDVQWGERLIRSWNEGWWDLQIRLGDRLAPLVGARPGEVIISDSTSVNLYKLAMAALADAPPERTKIVTDDLNFPSDVYILDGVAKDSGAELTIVQSDGVHGPVDRLLETIDDSTALVALSHTVYSSGYTYDMAALTEVVRSRGAMMLWDVSHSVGAMPIDFEGSGVDLAVGCTYKYLNGGPGSPALLYVRQEHQDRLANPITAWWGHGDPFEFGLDFYPVKGMRRFHTGTMPILSLAAIEPGLEAVLEAGVDAIRAKSTALTEMLIEESDRHLSSLGFTLMSPRDPNRRGSHVSLSHDLAWPITAALIERARLIPDFRAPSNIRLGLSPLTTSFVEVHTAVQRIRRVVVEGAHEEFAGTSAVVT